MGEDGIGAAQALPGLDGLLRTVRTPEFAGTVFHEVEARSALNRVPASSMVPFQWTVNPYRGCSHACVYCLAGPTRVLLADGRTRAIADLAVGDVVLGTERVDGARRYVPTRVLAHWSTTKPAYVVRLADGTALVTSGEHRFLTAHGWRHVSAGWCRGGRRPHLRTGTAMLGTGPFGPDRPRPHTADYRQGYLCGLVRGDGEAFPSDRLALEALGRAHHLLAEAPPAPVVVAAEPGRIARAVGAQGSIPSITGGAGWSTDPGGPGPGWPARLAADVLRWPVRPGVDWCAGFLAGVVDARGVVAACELRVVHADEAVVGRVAGALHRLGFGFSVGAQPDGARVVRLLGGVGALRRLLAYTDPAVSRRLEGGPVVRAPELEVVSVRALGRELPMYDITTGTGDFVAEGVVSHNCFARNTHTYLDLDAGADFDSQIIVKVNVARVLRARAAVAALGAASRWRWAPTPIPTSVPRAATGSCPGSSPRWPARERRSPILTKGTVLTRDLPELAAAAADVPVVVGRLDRAARPGAARARWSPARPRRPPGWSSCGASPTPDCPAG